jgi:transposase
MNQSPRTSQENQEALFRKQHYLLIGDQFETIHHEIPLIFPAFSHKEPPGVGALCAFITIFQYIEITTDLQAAEAVRTRPDWKYALHLPLSYDEFDPGQLCAFRASLLAEPTQQIPLQALIGRLANFDLFASMADPRPGVPDVLTTVCQINQIVRITEALLQALETLVASSSIEELGMPGPDLYREYAQIYTMLQKTRSAEEVTQVDRMVEERVIGLFKMVDQPGLGIVKNLPEFRYLGQLWQQHYHPSGFGPAPLSDRLKQCHSCRLSHPGIFPQVIR